MATKKTSNELYLSRNVRHAVELHRYNKTIIRQIIRELDKAEPRMRAKLMERLSAIEERGIDLGPRTTRRIEKMLSELEDLNIEAHRALGKKVTKELTELAEYEVEFQKKTINLSLPVEISLASPSAKTLKALVTEKPFQGATLKQWLTKFARNDRDRMFSRIRQGIVDGETPTDIARAVFGSFGSRGNDGVRAITRRGAQALAQTSTSHIANRAREELWWENKDIFTEVQWVSTLDGRTSAICQSLDGKRWPVGEGQRPPAHINCRSTVVAVINGKAVGNRPAVAITDKQLEGLNKKQRRAAVTKAVGQRPASETYPQWLKQQDKKFVVSVLGKDKAKAFLSGDATLDKFVSPAGKALTLKELRAKEII